MIAPDSYEMDDCCQCLLTHGITFPMVSPCIGSRLLSSPGMMLATKGNFQDHHDYHELLCSQCTLPVSCKSPDVHPFTKPYASDLHGIEEEIIFSSSDDNEERDDEDTLLEFEPCIPFATQLFPHHDSIFLQALHELEPSSMEMIHQKCMLCHDDFSDGELSLVITGEPTIGELNVGELTVGEPTVGKSVIGEPACFGSPKGTITSSAGFSLDTSSLNQDPALIALH